MKIGFTFKNTPLTGQSVMISRLLNKFRQFTFYRIETKKLSLSQSILFYLLCLSEVALILCFVPISFANNDDTTMNAIASGAMTGEPSEYLLFSNIIIGHILTFLYSTIPDINWYAWYLIATFASGYTFIQYFFFKITPGLLKNIIIHLVILAFLYPTLLDLQFTKIAATGLAGGFILIFSTAREKNYFNIVLGILLVVIGALIRKEVFYMYLVLTAPFLLIFLINEKKEFVFSTIAILIAFSAIVFDNYQYSNSPSFQEYRDFNKLRSRITTHDNPSFTFENYESILEEVGWETADFNIASNFNIDLGHPKFSETTLTRIVENIDDPSISNKTSIIYSKLYHTIRSFIRYLILNLHYFLFFFIFLLWNLIARGKKRYLLAGYLVYTVGIALMVTLILDGSLKERIIWNFILPLFLLSLIFTIHNPQFFKIKTSDISLKKILLPGILILISVSLIARYTHEALILKDERRLSDKNVASYLAKLPLDFYVSWCNLDSYNALDLPYSQQNQYFPGWLAGSPFNKEKIKKYTGKENIGVYTIFTKDIVWIFRNNFFYKKAEFHEKVKAFYLHNYKNTKIDIEILPVNEKDTLYKYTFFIPRDESKD